MQTVRGFAPPARVDWLGYLLVVVMPVGIVLLNVVPAGCVQVSHCQPLPSHWFCSFGLNYPRNLFGLNMIAWRLPWGDCGWTWDQPGRAVKKTKNQKSKLTSRCSSCSIMRFSQPNTFAFTIIIALYSAASNALAYTTSFYRYLAKYFEFHIVVVVCTCLYNLVYIVLFRY